MLLTFCIRRYLGVSNGYSNKDSNRKPGKEGTLSGHVRRHQLFIEVAREALERCAFKFIWAPWKMEAWWLRCLENNSWDEVERLLKRHGIHAGWRKIRRAVSEVAAYLREELLAQGAKASKGKKPAIRDFGEYYRREGNIIYIYEPCLESSILLWQLYIHLLVTELAGSQILEIKENIVTGRGRMLVLRITER